MWIHIKAYFRLYALCINCSFSEIVSVLHTHSGFLIGFYSISTQSLTGWFLVFCLPFFSSSTSSCFGDPVTSYPLNQLISDSIFGHEINSDTVSLFIYAIHHSTRCTRYTVDEVSLRSMIDIFERNVESKWQSPAIGMLFSTFCPIFSSNVFVIWIFSHLDFKMKP